MGDKVYTFTSRQLLAAMEAMSNLEDQEVADLAGISLDELNELPDDQGHVVLEGMLNKFMT